MPLYVELEINQVPVRLTYEDPPESKKVTNIEFQLTNEQRRKVLCKLYDSKARFQTSAYTYLFQNNLARYQGAMVHELARLEAEKIRLTLHAKPITLVTEEIEQIHQMNAWMNAVHALSAEFIVFEKLINNPGVDSPDKVLQNLSNALITYQQNIQNILEVYRNDLKLNAQIKLFLDNLSAKLQFGIKQFKDQINHIHQRGATRDELNHLLSIQTRDHKIKALGTWMAEQMITILATSIKVAYKHSDNRLRDLVKVPPAVAALSDAKAQIELKAFSLDGAEYNDTYQKIPQGMLDALTPASAQSSPTATTDIEQKKWLSVSPYLSHFNPQDIDQVVCLITDEAWENRRSAIFFYRLGQYQKAAIESVKVIGVGLLKIVASTIEIVLYVPLRLGLMLLLATFDVVGSLGVKKDSASKWTNRLDQQLSKLHERFSVVKWSKRLANRRYQRLTAEAEPLPETHDHQKLINGILDDSNFFHQIFSYLSAQRVADYVRSFFSSVWMSAQKALNDFLYLTSNVLYKAKPKDIYAKVHMRYVLSSQLSHQQQVSLNCDVQSESSNLTNQHPALEYCAMNEIATPLEVFREIILTLDDTVINPMFRKSPGMATFYFMISMSTFGTYLAPAGALSLFKSIPAFMQIPTNLISIAFTGKATSVGVMEKMVACFLEWKLGFFSTELLLECREGNFTFFNELVKEPEKLTLGLIGLVGLGNALQYLPLLPTTISLPQIPGFPPLPPIYNFYAEVYNVFVNEARELPQGTPGLTGIEYGFLGLKFAMLLHSMAAGSYQAPEQSPLQQLVFECADAKFTTRLMKALEAGLFFKILQDERESVFEAVLTEVLQQVVDEKKLTNKISTETLTNFKHKLKSIITPENLKQCIVMRDPAARVQEQNKERPQFEETLQEFKAIILPPTNETELAKAHRELTESLTMASDSNNPLIFDKNPLKEAYKFYDHLDELFNRYNHALQKAGRADLCVDKHNYLDLFYNKYCYQGSNNLLRSLLFLPTPIPVPPFYIPGVYIGVALYRGLKYLLARGLNKPSIAHQVKKSFSKDLVIILQILAMATRTMQVLGRAVSYSLRPFVAGIMVCVSALPYGLARLLGFTAMTSSEWLDKIDQSACAFVRLHDTAPWHVTRTLYAKAARVAGTSSEVSQSGQQMLAELKQSEIEEVLSKEDLIERKNLSRLSPRSSEGKILERIDRPIQRTKDNPISPPNKTKIAQELGPIWGSKAHATRKALGVKGFLFYPARTEQKPEENASKPNGNLGNTKKPRIQ